ncbi:DUF4258 domain-containing protein [Allomuricauda sp. d1]|uniref:DUF4258 domain-containing protein n=1 Tax=Allomuricauda sp. d1 TaxID=3136725 RepID=UPI0031D1C12A
MVLLKRIGWYLVGLSIGLVFLMFFLKKKSEETGVEFCYLPNCRVLKDIRSKPLSFSEEVLAKMESVQMDSMTIVSFLKDGDIDFAESDAKANPCKLYKINKDFDGRRFTLDVENCNERAILKGLAKE